MVLKEYDQAYKAYRKALDLLPTSVELHFVLADINFLQENYHEGIRLLRDALNLEGSDRTLERLGIALILNKNWQEAHEVLSKVKQLSKDGLYAFAITKFQLKQKITFNIPQDNSVKINYPLSALLDFENGSLSSAISKFRSYGEGNWKSYHSVGVIYFVTNSPTLAQREIKTAIESYKEQEEIDSNILFKLQTDLALCNTDPKARLEELKKFFEENATYDLAYGIAVTYYELFGYSEQFSSWLNKAIELRDPPVPNDQEKAWMEKVKVIL
jgi:tetratricopeptide (TPR) repeat protein